MEIYEVINVQRWPVCRRLHKSLTERASVYRLHTQHMDRRYLMVAERLGRHPYKSTPGGLMRHRKDLGRYGRGPV